MLRTRPTIARRQGARGAGHRRSLGQVASQTLENLATIDAASPLLVLRPLPLPRQARDDRPGQAHRHLRDLDRALRRLLLAVPGGAPLDTRDAVASGPRREQARRGGDGDRSRRARGATHGAMSERAPARKEATLERGAAERRSPRRRGERFMRLLSLVVPGRLRRRGPAAPAGGHRAGRALPHGQPAGRTRRRLSARARARVRARRLAVPPPLRQAIVRPVAVRRPLPGDRGRHPSGRARRRIGSPPRGRSSRSIAPPTPPPPSSTWGTRPISPASRSTTGSSC